MAAGDRNGLRTGSRAPYIFPRHPREVDRLDLQHYALREALGINQGLLTAMQHECEQHQSTWTLVFAFGQRSG